MNTTDMPTVEELRQIARRAYETLRQHDLYSNEAHIAGCDISFVRRELINLTGSHDVLDQEYRRDELLRRGYTPPEELE